MSEAVKIHPDITKSDGLVIYDRDNVMVDPTIYITMREARIAQSAFPDSDIWSVVVERKHKVSDTPEKPKRKRSGKIELELVADYI